MQQPLENALRHAAGKPSDAASAQMTVRIDDVQTHRDIYTITRAAAINEYLLTLTVAAHAERNGQTVGNPINITVNRTMSYADSEVLGKYEERENIWAEMRADAAEQIVRRLSFLKAQ